ncbi:hypothetical protein [Spirosoma sp. 48-14]|uniref:hypothetical protein n=1 Tax=Spirosoma sp. 48-14 TaxID=1895854 RepID=UPI00095AABF5|nr:hypothetical protein [Spirosoma sp. 48-14]OJW76290.1 MAG: hypothetical protein BGO59_22490 [Spirosoma sp. 48-14]
MLLNATGTQYAVPFYSAYINEDCKVKSVLAADYVPVSQLPEGCQQVNALIEAINQPYTGNSTGERLTWLKRRRTLLLQRAEVIAKALKDLGSTDVVDHTAVDIRSISSIVGTFASAVPGYGQAIGLAVATAGQLIGGLIDTTKGNIARRDEEISYYKADYNQLQDILNQTNQEIDRLSLVQYSLWGILAILLIVLFVKNKKS